MIILIILFVIPGIFCFIGSYCEYADYQAYLNGNLCESSAEFGFDYVDLFRKGIIYILCGIVISALRILSDKNLSTIVRIIILILSILTAALLIFV